MKSIRKICMLVTVVFFLAGFSESYGSVKYEKYASGNRNLDFTIDHVEGWQAREQPGSRGGFYQVSFYAPEIKNRGLRAMVVVTVYDGEKVVFEPKTPEGMCDDIIKRRRYFNSARTTSRNKRKCSGQDAIEVDLSYKTMSRIDRMDAKLMPYRERIIVFERGGNFYVIRYANFAADFNKYSDAFTHIVESLEFTDS